MQLILEADNSDINIKEKMTTVEDSIEKLMNGVAEIEKTPEKGNVSNQDKENKSNGDHVIESENSMETEYKAVLEEVQVQRCEDMLENKILEKAKESDSNKENGLNENKVEAVQLCDVASKNDSPLKQKVLHIEIDQQINSFNEDDVTKIQENTDTGDKSLSEEVPDSFSENVFENDIAETEKLSNLQNENILKSGIIESRNEIESGDKAILDEAPDIIENRNETGTVDKTMLDEASILPCEVISENKSTEPNDETRVIFKPSETEGKTNSDGESRVDITEEIEMSFDNDKLKKGQGFREELGDKKKIDVKQEVNEHNLKAKDAGEISEQKTKETQTADDASELETSVKLCEYIDKHFEEEISFSSVNVDKNDGSHAIDNKVENSKTVKNQALNGGKDVKKCNLEKKDCETVDKEGIKKVSSLIPDNTDVPKISTTDVNTEVGLVLHSTVRCTELLENESSDVKQADMECGEIASNVTEPNESAPTTMDCDRDDLDLLEKQSTGNLLDTASGKQTKEDTGVEKAHCLENEATDEVSEKVIKDINKAAETKEKDVSTILKSTVGEKIDTDDEITNADIIKHNEVPEVSTEEKETSSEFKNGQETVDKKDSALMTTITDSPCKDVNSDIEEVKVIYIDQETKSTATPYALTVTDSPCKDVNSDIEEVKVIDMVQEAKSTATPVASKVADKATPVVKLSNTLSILSDDEDEPPKTLENQAATSKTNDNKQCINIEDDDDVMVIEDAPRQDEAKSISSDSTVDKKDDLKSDSDAADGKTSDVTKETEHSCNDVKESAEPQSKLDDSSQRTEKIAQESTEELRKEQPLLPKDLFKSYKRNLTEMTRDDLEEFCILKIVESIIDRSSLNEIKTKLKTMAQTIEEYKKKAMMLTKQNRDLQVVLKSIQEEQKKGGGSPIVPLKITRSVGMQVLMTDKNARRKVTPAPTPGPSPNVNNRLMRNINQSPRQQTPVNATNQQIPVPRLVPATNNAAANKAPNLSQVAVARNLAKPNSSIPNGVKNSPPVPKAAEKRVRPQSITVDLTDDEPPPKIPAPPVRVVPSQNLLTPRAQMTSNTLTNPRKVYIPIGSNQNPSVRPGQTIMLKNVPNAPGPRPRGAAPIATRGPTPNQIRMSRVAGRHPAPLPDAVKQYQPPNWKALPPAPDLKLSKVENGIVISWKIDGYQEDSYEEIASYQLYAYQETSSPPNTSLWKKIGDVKALPLPMACTLTQFMAGYKYYFAVRAVDIRSRLGPFSLPGSILLLNKM